MLTMEPHWQPSAVQVSPGAHCAPVAAQMQPSTPLQVSASAPQAAPSAMQ